ncbi:Ig-like domain repeat protein [Spirillospora sp. NPDC052269]
MWLSGLTAVLMAVTCLAGSPAAADRRPVAAAPPTDLALGTGNNNNGQLGDGTTTNRTIPGPVHLPAGVALTQVSAGWYHSLGLTSDGRVLAWGANNYGQLGDGTTTSSDTPVETHLPPGVTVTQVVAAGWVSLAVTADGRVLSWGYNNNGQLGDGTTTTRYTPGDVDLPAGAYVTQVAAKTNHVLAVTSGGQVLAWGNNVHGQLGDNTTTTPRTRPVQTQLPAGVTVTQVAATSFSSLALTSDHQVLGWGFNSSGQVGDGTTTNRTVPVLVHVPEGVSVTQIAAGFEHGLALTSQGGMLAWGHNGYGQLGDDTYTNRHTPVPVQLPEGVTITQMDAGFHSNLAVTSHGHVLGWGTNSDGELGDGTVLSRSTPVYMELGARAATEVAPGAYHSLVLAEPRTSDTTLAAEPTYAAPGHEVRLTATVSCARGTPTGTVVFLVDGTEIGSAGVVPDGIATLTTTQLGLGTHQITARYGGDANCPASESEPVFVHIFEHPPEPCVGKLEVTKSAEPVTVQVGGRVRYAIRVTNLCASALHATGFTDDLAGVLHRGRLVGSFHATSGHVTYHRPLLHWVGDLAPGATATITYTVVAHRIGAMRNRVTWHCEAPQQHADGGDGQEWGECAAATIVFVVVGPGHHRPGRPGHKHHGHRFPGFK